MKQVVLILLFLVVVIAGCKEKAPTREPSPVSPAMSSSSLTEESHKTIERYNRLLAEGYKSMNMTNLQEVATKELAEKAYYHMAAISEGNSRLVSDVKKIDFVKTDCSRPATCTVLTKETWDFAYADALTGQRSNEVKNYTYEVRYQLERRGGRLIITDIAATGEERKELPSWGKMFKKE